MLVIGLHGWFLHPIAILLCDMVVYSEFLIHPILLLSTSTKLRQEIKQTLQRLCQDTISFANGQTDFCIKVEQRDSHGISPYLSIDYHVVRAQCLKISPKKSHFAILKNQTIINAKDKDGQTALILACEIGHFFPILRHFQPLF